jgi:hypothetical protein
VTTRQSISRNGAEDDFVSQAQQPHGWTISELTQFVLQNKKWWLMPIVVVLLMASLLMILGGTALAPFIYPLF